MPPPTANPRATSHAWTSVHIPFDADIETLAECVGPDRHLRTICGCGEMAEFDATAWLDRRLGDFSMVNFTDRLRCPCGRRQGRFEVWPGPAGCSGLTTRSAASLYD
jgi:hypothetical protein